ncbi:MAG TPA: cation:proton antiporter [Deltaproteobacteria bacterium]|nr:cation:proton antiporter [Deltaproteobacteria bacterium]
MSSFFEITAILVLAAVTGVVGMRLRQPLIIAFLAAGILAGPSFLGIIQSYEQIELFAHIGIALLLFIVGLKLDIHLIRTTGPVALATGLGQVVFTSAIGFLIALGLGMDTISAVYVSIALTFSSTIIIVKLLSDKKEIDSLHGRIALGFLIVQDIMAILALIALATLGTGTSAEGSRYLAMGLVIMKGIGLLLGIWLLMRFVLPGLMKRLAGSGEMMMLFAITWAMLVSALSDQLGLSKEVGAFLAGIALASTEYRDAIGARLITLRDFLLVFFFIDLGSRMEWATVGTQIGQAAIFSLFVLIGNPIIVLVIMGFMGYRRRTGLLAGLTVAQISEFSLIVAATGLALGHISAQTMGLITLVGVVTILASTYMILYSGALYEFLSPWIRVFERKNPYREAQCNNCFIMPKVDFVLMGLGEYGRELAENLLERGRQIIGVDFDPQALEFCRTRGIPVLYGDMGDPETHEGLPLANARWVVSTIRNPEVDLLLLKHLREKGFTGKVALTARTKEDAELYLQANPSVVLRPHLDAAEQGADALAGAWHALSQETDWPVAFREIRIKSGSAFAGHSISTIPLRSETGVSIVAASRAGRVFFNPGPDFQLFPSDRIVIMGPPEDLRRAETMIHRVAEPSSPEDSAGVSLVEIRITPDSPLAGKTLEKTGFRQRYGSTVIGIRRDGEYIISPGPQEPLGEGSDLLVLAAGDHLERLANDFDLSMTGSDLMSEDT